MWTILVILLIVWLAMSIIGFIGEGLLWLAIVGIVLFVGTSLVGVIRQRAGGTKSSV